MPFSIVTACASRVVRVAAGLFAASTGPAERRVVVMTRESTATPAPIPHPHGATASAPHSTRSPKKRSVIATPRAIPRAPPVLFVRDHRPPGDTLSGAAKPASNGYRLGCEPLI